MQTYNTLNELIKKNQNNSLFLNKMELVVEKKYESFDDTTLL
jgi:hypothetical protein